jgi:sulfate adenylyltransferase
MHRSQFEATFRAATSLGAGLLLQPTVGYSSAEDIDHFTRVRAYQALLRHYQKDSVLLNLLPLASRGGGSRQALLSAIVHRNYGVTHLMSRHDCKGKGDRGCNLCSKPGEAIELLRKHEDEIGIKVVPYSRMVYLEEADSWMPEDRVSPGKKGLYLTMRELKQIVEHEEKVPDWFTFPEVLEEVKKAFPPRHRKGFTLFFTGLPGAGKSTVAKAMRVKLLEAGTRPVTLLDGDIVRKHLSKKLGFSKEDRDINIKRIGFVASEITKNGGVAICAPIAPYDATRKEVRRMIEKRGSFILVHVSTPVSVCEERDPKGMYAKARAGIIREFTGVSDPYEVPQDAEIVIDTSILQPEEAADKIVQYIAKEGYLGKPGSA